MYSLERLFGVPTFSIREYARREILREAFKDDDDINPFDRSDENESKNSSSEKENVETSTLVAPNNEYHSSNLKESKIGCTEFLAAILLVILAVPLVKVVLKYREILYQLKYGVRRRRLDDEEKEKF